MPDKHSKPFGQPFTPTLSTSFSRSNKSPLTPKLAKPGSYNPPKRVALERSPSPSKDAVPASATLSNNVTPRSGSRVSRRDGAISSPANTPTSAHPSPQLPAQPAGSNQGRTDRSPVQNWEPSRTTRAKTLTAENIQRPLSTPMFFHASDASTPEPDPRPKLAKSPSFFYADGQEQSDAPTPAGTKRRSSGPRPTIASRPSPVTSPRLRPPNQGDWDERRSQTSHSGESIQLPQPNPSQLLQQSQQSQPAQPSQPSQPINIKPHVKSASVDTASTPPRERYPFSLTISPSESRIPATSPSEPCPRIFSDHSSISETYAVAQSPGKSETGQNDLAVNARTERKILDLEISNSSLLAINRTLEREMRKQHAELRRFRRLSRTGRLSMAPSSRSISGTLSVNTDEDGTSELSSVRSPDGSDSDEESMDEGVLSPGSLAEHDSRHQARDEKRFYADLARHQSLLVGSQKMDQSLGRCLGWTEELITEGRKALEYSVHVSDIELGGRVLSPDELDDVRESARGLLSPTMETPEPGEPGRSTESFESVDSVEPVESESAPLSD